MGSPPGNQPGGCEDPDLRRWAAGLGDAGEGQERRSGGACEFGLDSGEEKGECVLTAETWALCVLGQVVVVEEWTAQMVSR
jgi:hypothetical protein